jgi:hypothetical protein
VQGRNAALEIQKAAPQTKEPKTPGKVILLEPSLGLAADSTDLQPQPKITAAETLVQRELAASSDRDDALQSERFQLLARAEALKLQLSEVPKVAEVPIMPQYKYTSCMVY